MKNFNLALGIAALGAILAGCGGSNGGSQLPSPGAMQLTAYHRSDSAQPNTYSPGSAKWLMYYYCTASSGICPSKTSNYYGLVTFYLKPGRYSALLITANKNFIGDLTNATLSDTVNVTAGRKADIGTFAYQGEPSCGGGGAAPNARFFFTTGGLFQYTHYWWSNPVSWTLAQGSASTISQAMNAPADWSDWNGKPGSDNPTKFANAISRVRTVGLSFGGGCFFENGVTVTGPKRGIFNSTFTE